MDKEQQFNPSNPKYKKIEDLPADEQNKFKANYDYKPTEGYVENGFVRNSVYKKDEAQEQAKRMQKLITSGQASNYNDAEKIVEEEIKKEYLIEAKKELTTNASKTLGVYGLFLSGLLNLAYCLENAGENELFEKIINKILPCAGVINVKFALEKLGDTSKMNDLDRAESVIGHEIFRLEKYSLKNIETPIFRAFARLIADIKMLWEDYRGETIAPLKLYRALGEENKIKEAEEIINNPDFKYKQSFEYANRTFNATEYMKRINALRVLLQEFLEKTNQFEESRIDYYQAVDEIEKEITAKLEQ
ncbi:MAG TPA: hypothetical protein P5232_02160 [Candidatus Moranbacteria bacterium]|nr:hypothetical protein [Candidatus Moranbacteria bacterium]